MALAGIVVEGGRVEAQPARPRTIEIATGSAGDDTERVHVVALHPWGGGPAAFARALDVDGLGCRARFTFLTGPLRQEPGYAWFSRRAADPDQHALALEVSARADELAEVLGADRTRRRPPTIVAGFSEGAMLALALGALHPESVDGVVAASGALPRELWPDEAPHAPSFAIVHGRRDPFVPFESTAMLARRLDASFVAVEGAHRFTGALRRAFRRALHDALAARGACH